MKIIISPTKTMKRKNYLDSETKPLFLNKSKELRSILEGYDKNKIQKLFKVSEKLTEQVYKYFNNPKATIQAINLYEGMAFKNMNLETWGREEFTYIESHLIILSAMYGALRPSDKIREYRLDYMVKFEEDLYTYWQAPLKKLFSKDDLVINLASQEFAKSVTHNNILNLHLLDEQGRNLSTQAKIGRGDILQYIVKNKIVDPEEIKSYNNLGYKFIKARSDKNNYYFSKE